MPKTSKERQAKLGSIVLTLFPKVMQEILKRRIDPGGLQVKYQQHDIRTALTENEISLMRKLPNMDGFTIQLSFKILRFEHLMHEPSCKWGNVPHKTEVEIADDVQRIIHETNEIIRKTSEEITDVCYEELQKRIQEVLKRVDNFLDKDTCLKLYETIIKSETNSADIFQELTMMQQIKVTHILDEDCEKREHYSRVSLVIIETFPHILRYIIRLKIPASSLYKMCKPYQFSFEQETILQQLQLSNSYDSLDISFIYKILRQFLLISPPTNGWGVDPGDGDTNLADDVERIRIYRNQIAHRCSTNIGKDEFDNYFDKFSCIGRRMDLKFLNMTNYEYQILGHKTCKMDMRMQAKYENALKQLENVKLRFEKRPIKFYWGESFDRCMMNLRSMLKDEIIEGRRKVRVQIIFQNEPDIDRSIDILNSLKDEINESLSGIEFLVARKGSIVLNVDLLIEMTETDETLQAVLSSFLEKILKYITTYTTESLSVVVLPVEEFTQWDKIKAKEEPVYLDLNIDAELFANDDKLEEQLTKISDAIAKHSNGSGTNQNITATLLPIDIENVSTIEEPFHYLTLRKQLNIKMSTVEYPYIEDCVKIGNILVFTDNINDRLIICHNDGSQVHHILLPYELYYITEVDKNTVAVSCSKRTILVVDIYSGSVINTINTQDNCYGISYENDNLYVIIEMRTLQVMTLAGKIKRSISLPSTSTFYIKVHRSKMVCVDATSVYCCSLDGIPIWKFKNEKYTMLSRATIDDDGNVYVTNEHTYTLVVIYDDGKRYREDLTKSDGLKRPVGIYFDKNDNILLVSNWRDGNAFLFDVKKNHTDG